MSRLPKFVIFMLMISDKFLWYVELLCILCELLWARLNSLLVDPEYSGVTS